MSKYSKGELDIFCKDEDFKRKHLSLCLPCWCNTETIIVEPVERFNTFAFLTNLPNKNELELLLDTNITDYNVIINEQGTYIVQFNALPFAIPANAFQNNPDILFVSATSVTSIGNFAFEASRLQEAQFSNCTNIGEQAFSNLTSLSNITINGVCQIGTSCFKNSGGFQFLFLSLNDVILGPTNGNDTIFQDIVTNPSFAIIIPTSLMTSNGGLPDGDIQYLIDNYTINIIPV